MVPIMATQPILPTCPHCGNPLLEEIRLFSPKKHKLLTFIRNNPGCTLKQIMDHLYGDDPTGGPESNIISSMLSQMRRDLNRAGLDIVSTGGPGATYQLFSLKDRSE